MIESTGAWPTLRLESIPSRAGRSPLWGRARPSDTRDLLRHPSKISSSFELAFLGWKDSPSSTVRWNRPNPKAALASCAGPSPDSGPFRTSARPPEF